MSKKFLRVYKEIDVKTIKPNLLVYGDVSGVCENCHKVDIKLDLTHCPGCQTEFKFIAFRNIMVHFPKVQKLFSERPQVMIIDFDDYRRNLGAMKAQEFLK